MDCWLEAPGVVLKCWSCAVAAISRPRIGWLTVSVPCLFGVQLQPKTFCASVLGLRFTAAQAKRGRKTRRGATMTATEDPADAAVVEPVLKALLQTHEAQLKLNDAIAGQIEATVEQGDMMICLLQAAIARKQSQDIASTEPSSPQGLPPSPLSPVPMLTTAQRSPSFNPELPAMPGPELCLTQEAAPHALEVPYCQRDSAPGPTAPCYEMRQAAPRPPASPYQPGHRAAPGAACGTAPFPGVDPTSHRAPHAYALKRINTGAANTAVCSRPDAASEMCDAPSVPCTATPPKRPRSAGAAAWPAATVVPSCYKYAPYDSAAHGWTYGSAGYSSWGPWGAPHHHRIHRQAHSPSGARAPAVPLRAMPSAPLPRSPPPPMHVQVTRVQRAHYGPPPLGPPRGNPFARRSWHAGTQPTSPPPGEWAVPAPVDPYPYGHYMYSFGPNAVIEPVGPPVVYSPPSAALCYSANGEWRDVPSSTGWEMPSYSGPGHDAGHDAGQAWAAAPNVPPGRVVRRATAPAPTSPVPGWEPDAGAAWQGWAEQ